MRPDHSSTVGEPLPPSTSAAHGHTSRSAAASQGGGPAAASRRMGSSGRAHGGGGGGGDGDRGGTSRPLRAMDVPELVLKLCKNILKKEREVCSFGSGSVETLA